MGSPLAGVENVREFDEDTAINATGALLCWGADEKGEEASPTRKNYRKRLQRL